jgi:hypothetical protein
MITEYAQANISPRLFEGLGSVDESAFYIPDPSRRFQGGLEADERYLRVPGNLPWVRRLAPQRSGLCPTVAGEIHSNLVRHLKTQATDNISMKSKPLGYQWGFHIVFFRIVQTSETEIPFNGLQNARMSRGAFTVIIIKPLPTRRAPLCFNEVLDLRCI